MKKLFAAVATIFSMLAPIVSFGQEPSRNQSLEARVDSIFSRYARTDAPGCAVAVVKAGKILYAKGYGMSFLCLL